MWEAINKVFTQAFEDKYSDDIDAKLAPVNLERLQELLEQIFEKGERHNASDMLKFIIQIVHDDNKIADPDRFRKHLPPDMQSASDYSGSNDYFFEGGNKLKKDKSKGSLKKGGKKKKKKKSKNNHKSLVDNIEIDADNLLN